jgi:hypothetical protein
MGSRVLAMTETPLPGPGGLSAKTALKQVPL